MVVVVVMSFFFNSIEFMNVFISWLCRRSILRCVMCMPWMCSTNKTHTYNVNDRTIFRPTIDISFYMSTDYYVCYMLYDLLLHRCGIYRRNKKECPFSIRLSAFSSQFVAAYHFRVFCSFAGTMFVHWYLYGCGWWWRRRRRRWFRMNGENAHSESTKDKCRERSIYSQCLSFLRHRIFHNSHTHASNTHTHSLSLSFSFLCSAHSFYTRSLYILSPSLCLFSAPLFHANFGNELFTGQ